MPPTKIVVVLDVVLEKNTYFVPYNKNIGIVRKFAKILIECSLNVFLKNILVPLNFHEKPVRTSFSLGDRIIIKSEINHFHDFP